MNNLRLFTSEKQIDQEAASKLREVLLKISLQGMKPSVFNYCQYVFLSYSQSLEPVDESDNFTEIEKSVVGLNMKSKVFDQEMLANILRYFRSNYKAFTSSKNDDEIRNLA